MTEEELLSKIQEIETRNAQLEAKATELAIKTAEIDELKSRFAPAQDPDLAYKPSTWKELSDNVDKKAQDAALKVLQEAEKKKEEERKKQEDDLKKESERIEKTFKELEDKGVLLPSKEPNDAGGLQRRQVLGALVSLGGQNIEKAVELAQSAWNSGMELDFDQNSSTVKLVRKGGLGNPNRDAFVASSASKVSSGSEPKRINFAGARGDLQELRKRYETLHPNS